MANAYTARAAENSYPARSRPESGLIVQQLNFVWPATVTANDTVELCKIPVNALITDLMLGLQGIDVNATATGTVSLGLTKATANDSDIDPVGFMSAAAGKLANSGALKWSSPVDFNGALAFPYLAAPDAVGPNIPADGIHSKLTLKVISAATFGGASVAMVKGWIGYTLDSDWASSSN